MAYAIVCALLEAKHSGAGQVVDAAMVDGAAVFCTVVTDTGPESGRFTRADGYAAVAVAQASFYSCVDGENPGSIGCDF